MHSFFKVLLWLPLTALTLVFTINTYSHFASTAGLHGLLRQEIEGFKNQPITFASLPRAAFEIKTALAKEDARPLLIDRYFAYYNSPMIGLGNHLVQLSDQYGVDPYLVVAIAQQESNLGKLMPPDCHNAWGWGIHSAGTLCFDSWPEGIDTFVSGLSQKYLAYGLKTPEEIMTRYNATSPGGAWAKGVNQFLEELRSGTW